ncbi:low molecular weight protein tyrosine phosphatase family protein [Pontiella sulfatireligans]|uniref:Phosphotyrosine protein phosphatase I domain-containing protein n=1 Tax=Pontiella sulfatireligans TaxID=2750658 RepID=A0A6C2UD04_9BACT|nr:low molecular weight protein tyrosine phosphatase family protein [Pontiella sulfatireligans]VGO18068.1 hypothetical protein SCARR_00119 [Pontiella sulfatireligans]
MKNILFICSRNRLRSPTAETIFCDRQGWLVRSAGLAKDAEVQLSAEDLEWADIVFVMESMHRRKLKEKFGASIKDQRVVCLGIPDNYEYMDDALIRLLKQKVPGLVG